MQLYVIYTEEGMFLSKDAYSSWREIQNEYPGYKTSLGPWEAEAVIDFLAADYSTIFPTADAQVKALIGSPDDVAPVTFFDQ